MRRNSLTFIIILVTTLSYPQQKDSISVKFNNILLKLESKIINTRPGNEYVIRSFTSTLEKIRIGEVSAVFDDELNYGISGCASAYILDDGTICFSFGKFVLDIYDAFPVLAEGIIVHEFQHIYDFMTKPKLIEISRTNPIEKSYFEVDGLTIEGIFFNSYLRKTDRVSKLESFFLDDARSGFWSVTAVFEKVDLELLHQIDDVEKNTKSKDEAIQKFINIGRELLDRIEFNDNDWNNYCNLISLRTFSYYSRQVIFDIQFATEGTKIGDKELKLSNFPEVDLIVNETLNIINMHKNSLSDFRNKIINSFDEEIKLAIK